MDERLNRSQNITGNFIQFIIKDKPYDPCQSLGELIDNSCDARAKVVKITVDKDSMKGAEGWGLSIVDDGRGVTDVDSVYGYSNHKQNPNERTTGMFGTGGTVAHAQLVYDKYIMGDVMLRTTTGDGYERVAIQQLGKMMNCNLPIDLPVAQTLPLDEIRQTGTTLRFTGGGRIRHISDSLDDIIPKIYKMYRLAIDQGSLEIIINKRVVSGEKIAWVNEPVEFNSEIVFDDIKHIYTVVCGEVAPGCPSGWDIVHLKRHVNHGVELVDFGMDLPPGFYGFVILGDMIDSDGKILNESKWPLSSNKDRLDTVFMRKLGKEFRANKQIGDLLERLNESCQEMSVQNAQDWLNEAIGTEPTTKEKRDPGEGGGGTVEPVGTGRKRVPKKIQPDRKVKDGKSTGFTVKLRDYDPGEPPFIVRRTSSTLELNLGFEGMKEWISKTQKNAKFGSADYVKGTVGLFLKTIWATFLYPMSYTKDAQDRVYKEFSYHFKLKA